MSKKKDFIGFLSVQIKDLYYMITDYYNQNSDILNLLISETLIRIKNREIQDPSRLKVNN